MDGSAPAGCRWKRLSVTIGAIAAMMGSPYAYAFSRPQLSGPSVPPERRVSLTHSHNDYEQAPPLEVALAARMDSVEVDVWLSDGELRISHWGREFIGTLADLYLHPLDRRVQESGTVSATTSFLLWIELKQDSRALLARVHAELARLPWVTRYAGDQVVRGAVDVVLTGSTESKRAYLRDFPVRYAEVDTHDLPASANPSACATIGCRWYAIDYTAHFRWDGWGEMPLEERRALQALVRRVHAEGRRLRLFAAPDDPTYWDVALEMGVDLINTDRPAELRRFLELPVVPKPLTRAFTDLTQSVRRGLSLLPVPDFQ